MSVETIAPVGVPHFEPANHLPSTRSFENIRYFLATLIMELARSRRDLDIRREDELRQEYAMAKTREINTYKDGWVQALTYTGFAMALAGAASVVIATYHSEKKDGSWNVASRVFGLTNKGNEGLKHWWESGVSGTRTEASSDAGLLNDQKGRAQQDEQREIRKVDEGIQEIEKAARSRAELVAMLAR